MRIPSYLVCNKYGKYHFRITFRLNSAPNASKNVFKRALATNNRQLAVTLARAVKAKIDRLWNSIPLLKMNWLETKEILNRIVEDTLQEYQTVVLENGTYGAHVANYSQATLETMAERFLRRISSGKTLNVEECPPLKEYINKTIIEHGLDQDPKKYDRNAIQIIEMLVKIRKRRSLVFKSLYSSIPEFYENVKGQFESNNDIDLLFNLADEPEQPSVKENNPDQKKVNALEKGHLLSELIKEFVEYKISKNLWKSPKTIELNKLKLKYISNVLECIKKSDSPCIEDFKREDALLFESKFQQLPSNLSKIIGASSDVKPIISKLIFGEIKEIGSSISPVTYNGYCDLLTGMFHWATLPKQGYIDTHPFIDIKIKNVKSNKREAFSSSDIRLFFNTNLFTEKNFEYKYAWRYFVPIIMAYSGMRLEECCQLMLRNIIKRDNIYCFDIKEEKNIETSEFITKIKNTGSSERIVPIHNVLRKVGFFRYLKKIEQSGGERVFSDLINKSKAGKYVKSGAKVSKWFNEDDAKHNKSSYLSKCGINCEGKQRKVLYVFRHTVETTLINHKQNIEHDKIDYLLGHQVTSIGRNNYGTYNPATLQRVVSYIQYPDSNLPWDTNEEYSKIPFIWE